MCSWCLGHCGSMGMCSTERRSVETTNRYMEAVCHSSHNFGENYLFNYRQRFNYMQPFLQKQRYLVAILEKC